MAAGILARKLGMSQRFDEQGHAVGVTLLEAGPCRVTDLRTMERDGYIAVQLGFDETRDSRLSRPERGHLQDAPAYRVLREFGLEMDSDLEVGAEVRADIFSEGDFVDVVGTSKGKGFAGVVKRHNFRGGPRTHGQSDRLRAPGSVGAGTTPGRVFKGMRMAGRMGGRRVTAKRLRVEHVDPEKNLIVIRGAVPGRRNAILAIRAATDRSNA
jgi:large subunit ribosomal protein L3